MDDYRFSDMEIADDKDSEFDFTAAEPKSKKCKYLKIGIGLGVGVLLLTVLVIVLGLLDNSNGNLATASPTNTTVIPTPQPTETNLRVFTPTCGPFNVVAAPNGDMNITYELGTSSPNNKPAIRISASTTSSGYGAVGFRNVHNSSIGHMYGIDVVAFDRRGVQDMVITTQPGPPARAPLPSIVVQDQLIVGNLIFARYFRDLQTNSSYDMPLFKGMMINVAYSLGVGQVGLNWQHHMFAGSQNITLQNC